MLSLSFTNYGEVLQHKFLSKFSISDDGVIEGDNRSSLMLNATDVLIANPSAFFGGIHIACTFDYLLCKERWGRLVGTLFRR